MIALGLLGENLLVGLVLHGWVVTICARGKRVESASPRYKHLMLPRGAEGDYEREAMGRYGDGALWKRMRCNTANLACNLSLSGVCLCFNNNPLSESGGRTYLVSGGQGACMRYMSPSERGPVCHGGLSCVCCGDDAHSGREEDTIM